MERHDLIRIVISELNIKEWQADNALKLRDDKATIPFIARYRKEKTGNLDENQIRELFDRFDYLSELEDRKKTILDSINSQGKLTDELKDKINACLKKTELEDLYLPYKPKKRTRAVIAREKGLEPLAEEIAGYNKKESPAVELSKLAEKYIDPEKEVNTIAEALSGANDIIAEAIGENAQYRSWLREQLLTKGIFKSKIKSEHEEGTTKYEAYREFEVPVQKITPHVMLALRRGESEGVINLDLSIDEEEILGYFEFKQILSDNSELREFYQKAVKEAYTRLMKHSIIGEIRLLKKNEADEASIKVFESNLRQILLSAPAGMKPAIGIDPGFRTGCKVAVLDGTGKYIEYNAIYPFNSENEKKKAASYLKDMIEKHGIELIAIGNGTAGRETDAFVSALLDELDKKPVKVMVNESGASVYSASKTANEEFPELDLTVRGAISIGRRLQDPLAELVKIDPKSIGVGQYQHDVDQKLLKKNLEETVESCVNYVGVDLNTASGELLTYVSGITKSVANEIVRFRNKNGAFKERKQLLEVPKFGNKTFEQAAGFLRIRDGINILDNTAVHPESYKIVESIAKDLGLKPADIPSGAEKLSSIDIKKYFTEEAGEHTLIDIIEELKKPGRDPRDEFEYARFKEGINEIKDLREGMILEGVVTNITNFGAFVDIGVHQDGLVHISEMADRFIKDTTKVVKVGQIVQVKVLDVNEKLKRINLSMKQASDGKPKDKKQKSKDFSVDDLKKKFGN
ncbi:MAG: Tex family protein [Candidatus Kapaibacterium sp.]